MTGGQAPAEEDVQLSFADLRHRRRLTAGVCVLGAAMLGASFSTRPGSRVFYGTTLGAAATWTVGGLAVGPRQRRDMPWTVRSLGTTVIAPVLTGASAFGVFYVGALVARRVPRLDSALRRVLRFADEGSQPLVLITTLANGLGEEVFFRGAVYAAVGERYPVALSTAVYTLVTAATRNYALVVAAAAMGTVFGVQRRVTGGIQAPVLTHATWATLMIRYVPPLFSSERG